METTTLLVCCPCNLVLLVLQLNHRQRLLLAERQRLIDEHSTALSNVKTLSGLLPICSSCRKVRNDDGYWQRLEHYVSDKSNASFTHGICPDCERRIYPQLEPEKKRDGAA